MGPTLKIAITFPVSWINDPESRKFLSENLSRLIRKGGISKIYQTSGTDKYFAANGQTFVTNYYVHIKYHSWQPLKLKITQAQMGAALKPVYPNAQCVGLQTFFVQAKSPSINPYLEMEIYYP